MLKKIFYTLFIFMIVIVVVFFSMRTFSDPITTLLGLKSTSKQRIHLKKELGLDQPLINQFKQYVINVFYKFDFGYSYVNRNTKSTELFWSSFLITCQIVFISCLIASLIGIFLGLIAAFYKDSKIDYILILCSILIISLPSYIIGYCMQYFLGFCLNLLPISGLDDPFSLILPILSLTLVTIFPIFRVTRTSVIYILEQPFILAARARGLSGTRILFKHALKNALVPICTHIGLMLGFMLSGSIIIESIFNINGLGSLIFTSFNNRDLPVIQCCVILLSIVISLFNIVLEFLCYCLDPTVKMKYS
ncbi:MAG: ABC transporter permease [Weeping tea tree witches'-broom phytoplasma]|uniref:ABC transporter permease n=1 Tax=Candidatus Phytoplasma melaleucae TaxID=2982630 RepID=UPI00293979DE|nr:ABC transporter permease [Weeping tea tree witches'-broom phytoplasma]